MNKAYAFDVFIKKGLLINHFNLLDIEKYQILIINFSALINSTLRSDQKIWTFSGTNVDISAIYKNCVTSVYVNSRRNLKKKNKINFRYYRKRRKASWKFASVRCATENSTGCFFFVCAGYKNKTFFLFCFSFFFLLRGDSKQFSVALLFVCI